MHRRTVLKVLAGASALAASGASFGESAPFPTKPIRLIVPYPPGGVTDVAGRLVGEILTKKFGQPVVVENRPGANGMIGSQHVAAAAPDGYTLLLNGLGGMVLPMATVTSLPLDIPRAFFPIAQVAEFINVLVVRADSPIKSVNDLIAAAKRKGNDGLSYGSNGIGSSVHMTTAFFAQRTGTSLLHVPYKGSGEMLIDVINGNLDFSFSNLPPVIGLIKKGTLRPIAVTSAYRSNQMPDVPTMAEQGISDFDVTSWLGVYGPAGMAPALVTRLSDAVTDGVKQPQAMQTLVSAGFEPKPANAQVFAQLNKAELDRWIKVASQANVSLKFGA